LWWSGGGRVGEQRSVRGYARHAATLSGRCGKTTRSGGPAQQAGPSPLAGMTSVPDMTAHAAKLTRYLEEVLGEGRRFRDIGGRRTIAQVMLAEGNGAIGVVAGEISGQFGRGGLEHVFTVTNKDGVIYWPDGQNGEWDEDRYTGYRFLLTRHGSAKAEPGAIGPPR